MNKNTSTAQKVREEIKAKAIARMEEVKAKHEEMKLHNELQYVESDKFIVDQIKLADDDIISPIVLALDGISDKQFSRYREFSYGTQANDIIGAAKTVLLQGKGGHEAIDLACAESLELAHFVQISRTVGQDLPTATGRNTYFNKLTGKVQEGEPGDAEQLVYILKAMARHLGLANLDTSKVTTPMMQAVEIKAHARAIMQEEDNQLLEPSNKDEIQETIYKTA